MKQISRINYFMFVFIMFFSLIASAENKVKDLIPGLEVNSPIAPKITEWDLANGVAESYKSFDSPYYGLSNYYKNNILIIASKTKEIKIDIPSLDYTTGWTSVNNNGTYIKEVIAPYTGYFNVKLSLRNETGIVSDIKYLFLEGNEIKDVEIKLCDSEAYNCDDYSDSINLLGDKKSASLTFSATNVSCFTIQSSNDSYYNKPKEKCWEKLDGSYAVFEIDYSNLVSSGSKTYTYNFTAINYSTGEEYTDAFTLTSSP